MASKARVMYVKYGRSLLQPWDRISHGKASFGMALNGRDEGLTWAARDGSRHVCGERGISQFIVPNNL